MTEPTIKAIYLSPGHDFFGRYDLGRLEHEVHSVEQVECVAGKGLRGDRFFDYKENYKGQVTFFDYAIYEKVRDALEIAEFDPALFRRNVLTLGVDLNSLIGKHFTIQGIEFEGTQESSPCEWMDDNIAPGAKDALKGCGGLRARILTDGLLTVTN